MPRTRRLIPRNGALHIMTRGNNQQCIFRCDEDKHAYWELLKNLRKENNISIFHYCIMSNHSHLIVWLDATSNLPKFMKQLNLLYFNYYKRTYGYSGHIWQGRYKSNIIDTDSYLLQCGKYIELNPVRSGLVKAPERYRFSSYCYYALGLPNAVISDSPAYCSLSGSLQARAKLYIEFVVDSSIVNSEVISKQFFIGSEAFVRGLSEFYQINNFNKKIGRPRG
ncbi:MAG: transposase [Candidatus Omnitrophota bacterium]